MSAVARSVDWKTLRQELVVAAMKRQIILGGKFIK